MSGKASEQLSHMRGTIDQIDPGRRRVTIRSLVVNKTFEVAGDATIFTAGKSGAGLNDLQRDQEVDVFYEQHDTTCIAHRLEAAPAQPQQKAA